MTVLFDNALEAGLTPEKKQLWQDWLQAGLPNKKQERWRYNSLKQLQQIMLKTPYSLNGELAGLIAHDYYAITFENGMLREDLTKLPEHISIRSTEGLEAVEDGFAFDALNKALSATRYQLTVQRGAIINKPIVIAHVGVSTNTHLDLSIAIEANAEARVIHYPVQNNEASTLMTEGVAIQLQDNAKLNYMQYIPASPSLSKVTMMKVEQAAHSVFKHEKIDFAAELSRLELDVELNGEGAEAIMQGIYYGHAQLHIDNYLRVYHNASHTKSMQHYRGLAADKSTTVFNGAVHVAKGVQGIEADQSNPNLLLSKQASMNTKPELVIYSDDVKCSHGATVGELDETALFYLRSRGIGLVEARQILIHAFLNEILSELPDDVFVAQMHRDLSQLEHAHD